MKISVDTKEDSHDDIRKVIRMLQHLVGESQDIYTNQPSASQSSSTEPIASPFANIFGDTSVAPQVMTNSPEATQKTQEDETSQSTEDLFAELFSEKEIAEMKKAEADEGDKDDEPKSKRPNIEFY